MADRYYFPSFSAASVTPAYWAGWDKTFAADRVTMIKSKFTTTFNLKGCSENVATDPYEILNRQYISDPIGAHDFTGCTWKAQIRCIEDVAKMDAILQIAVRVVSNDGTSIRFEMSDAIGSTEFDDGTLTNRTTNDTSVAQSSQNGDRIIVEIGVNTTNTKTNLYTATMEFGNWSASDLPEDETETTQWSPWIEFSHDIAPYDPGGVTPGWNRIEYTSEPPTPNAWNQIKREAGTGWKKLEYE